jgi:hypothetical protein
MKMVMKSSNFNILEHTKHLFVNILKISHAEVAEK